MTSPDRTPISYTGTGYARIVTPPDAVRTALVVHGYGQSPTDFLAYAQSVVPGGTAIVAPEGPSAFYRRPRGPGGAAQAGVGYGWIADPNRDDAERRNDDFLAHALSMAASAGAPTDDLLLLGYSQGVGVATHFAVRHAARVRGLVGLAGGVPAGWRDQLGALRDVPVLWVTGTEDHAYAPEYNAELVTQLSAAGADLTHCLLEAGHDLLAPAAPDVRRWLAAVAGRG